MNGSNTEAINNVSTKYFFAELNQNKRRYCCRKLLKSYRADDDAISPDRAEDGAKFHFLHCSPMSIKINWGWSRAGLAKQIIAIDLSKLLFFNK